MEIQESLVLRQLDFTVYGESVAPKEALLSILESRASEFGLGERRLTTGDFYDICEAEGVEVISHPGEASWYMEVKSRPFIVLSDSRKGIEKEFVMFHELGHYFLHAGNADRPMRDSLGPSKKEFEANAFALLALLPLADIEAIAEEDIEDGYHTAALRERLRLLESCGV
ncbi:MAG TPA: ImmA/IrrE family metallo-endopeptidase [Aridibacter sp.]|nr:ImmA/IrrE family metallo-endopeptidase [Aridibacter sp.]